LDEESILQPNLITSIKQNKELHTLEVMNVKIFESNLINNIEKEKNPIEKPMSKTIQREFSNSFESKEIPSNLDQLNNDNNHSRIIFRKKEKQRMYWSTEMNEFLKNAIENSNLDYKAIAVKFISLHEGLYVTIPQIIKHIKLIKSKIHYKNKEIRCEENVSIDQHDANEHKNNNFENKKRPYIHWKDYDIYMKDHIIHNHEYDNIQSKINVFYEKFPDCQLTNKQIAKRLKYINNKKEDNVQYVKDKIDFVYQTETQYKVIDEYSIEKNIECTLGNDKNIKSNNSHHKQSSMQILKHLKHINKKIKLRSMKNKKTSYGCNRGK
jgi:hypothetical protein